MFESFNLMEFPATGTYATGFPVRAEGAFLYVICWVNNEQEVPFYVGETARLKVSGRYRGPDGAGTLVSWTD
jgi:hypothetical protein